MYEYLEQYLINNNIRFNKGIFKDKKENIESLIFYCTLEECVILSKKLSLEIADITTKDNIKTFTYTNDNEIIYNFSEELFNKYVIIHSTSSLILFNL